MMNTAQGWSRVSCARCGQPWDSKTFRFGLLSMNRPLCAACFDNVTEHGRSWGGDYAEFEERVRQKLTSDGLAS
jgi:hypothetical protein